MENDEIGGLIAAKKRNKTKETVFLPLFFAHLVSPRSSFLIDPLPPVNAYKRRR
jgi:hypothetical protein